MRGNKMKIGILCPSEIAYRRFLPAMKSIEGVDLVGIGINSPQERYGDILPDRHDIDIMLQKERDKAEKMLTEFGGEPFGSYEELISSPKVEALYIPLPPALHYKWTKVALKHGKHVLVEKPSTTLLENTEVLVDIARSNSLALHENYMFIFHNQLNAIESVINSGEIGEVRLYRISFGFPRRAANDFRYNKALGGGALIDAGGYTIKYATRLLGESADIMCAHLNYTDEFKVDIYGSGTLINREGVTAQIAFGMDNDYKCELEVWGSKGTLKTGRVLTAPAGFVPTMIIKKNTTVEERTLPADDAFKKSIEHFMKCISNADVREENYRFILKQAQMVEQFLQLAKE